MSTLLSQSIPIFESGYPLRVDDLDNMFNYLDDNERHTRICLIGAGIFYGLEVEVVGTTITIKSGAGVTSQGFLYCEKAPKSFTKYRELGKYSSAYLTNTNNLMEGDVATLLTKSLIKPSPTGSFDFDDVLELAVNGDKDLSIAKLEGRVVVIVFERKSDKRNGCTTCNKGTNGQVNIRFLLVKTSDWNDSRFSKCDLPTLSKPNLVMQFPYLQRFGLIDTCANRFSYATSDLLNGQYQSVVNSAIDRLLPHLNAIVDDFATVFKRNATDDKAVVTTGTTLIKGVLRSKQDIYDYTKHLIQAYNEFVEKPFLQIISELPNENCFPKYLSLAGLKKDSETIIADSDKVRLPFYRPPFSGTGTGFEEAKFLYERLIGMLKTKNLIWGLTQSEQLDRSAIKITPSHIAMTPLSNRAIPYYFDGKIMRSTWHFNLSKTNRTQSIAAYDRAAVAPSASVPPFDEPFLYQNAFDNADFYRIEGHIGSNLGTVWNRLVGKERTQPLALRTCLNLPFSVEIVELSTLVAGAKTIFTRLEEFAKTHTGLEHQGGVMRGGTLILVAEGRTQSFTKNTESLERDLTDDQENALALYSVVADFCLPYWVTEKPRQFALAYFTIENIKEDKESKQVDFINRSPTHQIFEWFVDDVSFGQSIDLLQHIFRFEEKDKTSTERTFVVTLVARLDTEDKLPDMASRGVTIKRVNLQVPVADFELASRALLFASQSRTQIGEIVTFENRSNNADTYEWSVVDNPNITPTLSGDKASFNLPFSPTPYKVRLVAINSNNNISDTAEQDVWVSIDKPIAIFTATKSASSNINQKTGFRDIETFSFVNTSSLVTAKSFEWRIDDVLVPISQYSEGKDLLNFPVAFGDNKILQREFTVTLIAFSKVGQQGAQDTARQIINISRGIKADFVPIRSDLPILNDKIEVPSHQSTASVTFKNLSENGFRYQWTVFVDGKLVQDPTGVGRIDTPNWAQPYIFGFTIRANDLNATIYVIQLIAFDSSGAVKDIIEKKLTIFTRPQVLSPNVISGTEAMVLTHDLSNENVETPTVDGLTASRNMEARRGDFRNKIEEEGNASPPLSKMSTFQNVVSFMAEIDTAVADFDRVSSLEKGFDKLDDFDKTFKTNALQLVQNIKKKGSVPDEAYRNVLRNLLFFYLDKLVHLLPDKLTATTERTVADVLAKVKAEQSFGTETLDDLRKAWKVADITTIQNVPVAEQLNGLFV